MRITCETPFSHAIADSGSNEDPHMLGKIGKYISYMRTCDCESSSKIALSIIN